MIERCNTTWMGPILIAIRISKSFNVVFKQRSDQLTGEPENPIFILMILYQYHMLLVFLFMILYHITLQFSAALTRNYVQTNGWLTWCCNPQGCGHILLKGIGMNTNMCQKCQWTSCFSCSFLEVFTLA